MLVIAWLINVIFVEEVLSKIVQNFYIGLTLSKFELIIVYTQAKVFR